MQSVRLLVIATIADGQRVGVVAPSVMYFSEGCETRDNVL